MKGSDGGSERMSIGHTLRQRREERGLTLEQAAFQSKVPLRLLQALEADDYHLLPDALYLIGLLHEYALLLKLDPAALEADFRIAIRRPPRTSLAAAPPPPPPIAIPWRHVVWTAAAILVVTPLVFIVLSLASRKAADRPTPPAVAQRPAEEQATGEGEGGGPRPDGTAPAESPLPKEGTEAVNAGPEPAGPPVSTSAGSLTPSSPRQPEAPRGMPGLAGLTAAPAPPLAAQPPGPPRMPKRFVLTASAVELTWMAVRSDGGERRQVLLQPGQGARFAADMGFLVTLGNAGGVDLRLNGTPVPKPGKSGEVVRDLALPQSETTPEPSGSVIPREGRKALE